MSTKWSDEAKNWLEWTEEKQLYLNKWHSYNAGVIEGRLIAGNNNAMYGSIGTEYFPEFHEGDILLIEDSYKDLATVEKNMAMLKLHGLLEKAGGIILSKYEQFNDLGTGRKPIDVLLEQLDGRTIPLLTDFDTGHTHPMHPLAIGKKVRLDSKEGKLYCIEAWQ